MCAMPSRDERKIDAQFFPGGQRVEIGWGSRFQRVLFYMRRDLDEEAIPDIRRHEPPDTVEFFLWILSSS